MKKDEDLAVAVAVAQSEISSIKATIEKIETNHLAHIKLDIESLIKAQNRQYYILIAILLVSIFGAEALEKIKGIL